VPLDLTKVFQGILLFYVLACDTLILYRFRLLFAPRVVHGVSLKHPADRDHRLDAAAAGGSGELVVERAGVLNLGVEGMMIWGAACGFAGAYLTGSIAVGALCGILGGAALSAVFAALTLGLGRNQVASGLALTILGVGLSGLIGAGYIGQKIEGAAHLYIPYITDIPLMAKSSRPEPRSSTSRYALIVGIWLLISIAPAAGLILRAVGRQDHASAHCARISGAAHRALAVLFGGGCRGPRRGLSALSGMSVM